MSSIVKLKCKVCGATKTYTKRDATHSAAKKGYSNLEDFIKDFMCKKCKKEQEIKESKNVSSKKIKSADKLKTTDELETTDNLKVADELVSDEEEWFQIFEIEKQEKESDIQEFIDEQILDELLKEEDDEEEI